MHRLYFNHITSDNLVLFCVCDCCWFLLWIQFICGTHYPTKLWFWNIHKFRIITYYTEFAATSECAILMNSLPQSNIQYQLFPILHFANGTYFNFGRFSTKFAWNSKASIWTYTYYIVMWYSFKSFLESILKSIRFLSKKSIPKEFSIDFFSTFSTHSQNDACNRNQLIGNLWKNKNIYEE